MSAVWFSGRLTLCVGAHSVMWQHSLVPRRFVFRPRYYAIIVNDLGTRLVPALQECHDVTCHWYRYLSHQADVTCRLLHLPAFASILCSTFLVDIAH